MDRFNLKLETFFMTFSEQSMQNNQIFVRLNKNIIFQGCLNHKWNLKPTSTISSIAQKASSKKVSNLDRVAVKLASSQKEEKEEILNDVSKLKKKENKKGKKK